VTHSHTNHIGTPQHEFPVDVPTAIPLALIYRWFLKSDSANMSMENKVTRVAHLNAVSPLNTKRQRVRVRPWRQYEIVFKVPIVSVIDKVNAAIDGSLCYRAILRYAEQPAR